MSARDLPIFVTQAAQAAPALTAQWLRRVLEPVVEACHFERAPPLEVRPVGAWAGVCDSRTFAPDRRVSLSSKLLFWSSETIVSVYLHECCHRLLESHVGMKHRPEFLCLNAVLLLRSEAAFESDPIFKLDFYDMQDCPPELENEPNWRGVVLNWALPVAAELAATDTSAEALADAVCQRWQDFLQDRETTRVQAAQEVVAARKYAAAQAKKIESLQSSIFFARTFLIVGWLCFLSVVYFVL